jgi:hypothetical protein
MVALDDVELLVTATIVPRRCLLDIAVWTLPLALDDSAGFGQSAA